MRKQYNVLTFVGDYYQNPTPILVTAKDDAEARSKATVAAKARQKAEIRNDLAFWKRWGKQDAPHPAGYHRAGSIRIHSVWLTFGQT